MRRILGYIDGRPVWSDNTPAEPLSAKGWMFGELVQGNPGYIERNRLANKKHAAKKRDAA